MFKLYRRVNEVEGSEVEVEMTAEAVHHLTKGELNWRGGGHDFATKDEIAAELARCRAENQAPILETYGSDEKFASLNLYERVQL